MSGRKMWGVCENQRPSYSTSVVQKQTSRAPLGDHENLCCLHPTTSSPTIPPTFTYVVTWFPRLTAPYSISVVQKQGTLWLNTTIEILEAELDSLREKGNSEYTHGQPSGWSVVNNKRRHI
ncbi:hypothetical protein J6590_050765 [Homalodisca vitripennis]|nr:hypothetical protein J6590_050765 [Homalodisca vitripennis]